MMKFGDALNSLKDEADGWMWCHKRFQTVCVCVREQIFSVITVFWVVEPQNQNNRLTDSLTRTCRKSFQSPERISADMGLSRSALERSRMLSPEPRLGVAHWNHQGAYLPSL